MGDSRCDLCPLLEKSEFHVLDHADRARLDQAKRVLRYGKGGVIFHQGESCKGMFCVRSGTVALRKTDEKGNTVLLTMVHEGQTLGIRTFFAGSDYQASAEALSPTTVCQIPTSLVEDFLARYPELDRAFLEHISQDLGQAREAILTNTSLPVRARLAHLLLSLIERFAGSDDGGEVVVDLPMNRHDMAELLCTRPETIARTISALNREGIVKFSGRRAMIPDFETLRLEAEGPLD